MKRFEGIALGLFAVLAILVAGGFKATPYDNFVLLADAFRHGRTWIDWPGAYIDALRYHGRYYVIEAPFPAVLLIPALAIWGTATNQTALAALLGGVATYAAYEIARMLDVPRRTSAFLAAFLLLGTDLFWCAMLGDVWFIAHVASAAMTLLAIREVLGKRRGVLVALYAVAAVESRFTMVLALPVYAALLWWGTGADASLAREGSPRAHLRNVIAYAATIVPFVALWIGYNESRWGVPYDLGYSAWYHQDSAGEPTGSPFRLSYIPYELSSFFVRAPDFQAAYPYVVPTLNGFALTWSSPALVLAFFARGSIRLRIAMWAAVALCFVPSVVYYVNGYAQFGMRHALDFEPFLFVLIALACRDGITRIGIALCGYSMLVGAWGCWYWRTFVRT